jgi:predicted outer membrane repeat protein
MSAEAPISLQCESYQFCKDDFSNSSSSGRVKNGGGIYCKLRVDEESTGIDLFAFSWD